MRNDKNAHHREHTLPLRSAFTAITSLTLLISAVIFSASTPLFSDIRHFERRLPQHNISFSQRSQTKYISFSGHIWGHGWNNVLQEYLMLSYLAHTTNRSFVFDDYIWSHIPLPYILSGFAIRPTRIPLNAFVAGPIAGGPVPTSSASYPRAIHVEFWKVLCPRGRRRVISSTKSPRGLSGLDIVRWWNTTIRANEDVICLEIDSNQKPIFNSEFFSSWQLLDVWPFIFATPVLTHFAWSPLVLSAAQRNFAVLPDIVCAHFLTCPLSTRLSFSNSTGSSGGVHSDILALHVRRGDFKRHCPRLAKRSYQFHGFNSFEGLPDPWIPFNGSGQADRIEYYRRRCLPSQDEIVERLHSIRADYDVFAGSTRQLLSNDTFFAYDSPPAAHRLQRVFILTNARSAWLDVLKYKLTLDGWEDVVVSGELVLNREQKNVDVAIDMSVAERAEVFVGNGFSSLSGSVVMLRIARGLPLQTNRFL